jgi:hypothetical protein
MIINKYIYYNIIIKNMEIDIFVNYIINNKTKSEIIKLDKDIDLMKIKTQKLKLINL